MSRGPFIGHVGNCARCGRDHSHVLFRLFQRPATPFSHWGECPTTREPILLKITPAKELCKVTPQTVALTNFTEVELPRPVSQGCAIPPPGWFCTRVPGHDGPCAAHPEPK